MATADFPGKIATWKDKVDFEDVIIASDINKAYAEIIAIEQNIGNIYNNEATRISNEDTRISNENTRITEVNYIKTAYDNATKANLSVEVSNSRHDNTTNTDYPTLGDRLDSYSDSLRDIVTVNANDFISLQAAHDYITANYSYGVLLIPSDIVLTDTFTWDVRKVSLKGYGVTLTFNIDDIAKYAIETISSETVEPYNQSTTLVQGIKFKGVSNLCNGFKFYSPAAYKSISHINFRNCEFSYFNKSLDFKERSYSIVFDCCDILRNTDAIYCYGSLDDCGERISFKDCVIYNNYNAITNTNGNCDMYFTNCSIDYNTNCIANISDGKVYFNTCHIEHRATNFTASNRPFIVNGGFATLVIIGGYLMFTSYADTTMDYVFYNTTTNKAGIFLDKVYMLGCRTTTNYISGGGGFTKINNTPVGPIEENATVVATEMNLMKDYSFEATSMQDEIFLISDTVAITSRTLTGSNISLSLDNTQYRTGVKSLKVNKVGGNGSNASFTIMVPIDKGALPGWELYYKKVGSQTGSMGYSYGFCKKSLDDVQYKKLTVGSSSVTFTSATVDWTRIKNNTDRPRVPMWATHLFIDLNLFSMYNGDLFFDDITVTQM